MIKLARRDLEKRRQTLQRQFGRVTRGNRVEIFYKYGRDSVFVGLGRDIFGSDLRRARHPSKYETIFINYYEVWLAETDEKNFYLEKAYLHLDVPRIDGTGDEEVLALHCDPITPQSDSSYDFKRGPHFHLSGNKRDISKAHIALCLTNTDDICVGIGALSNAFDKIIDMIDRELLPCFA